MSELCAIGAHNNNNILSAAQRRWAKTGKRINPEEDKRFLEHIIRGCCIS